jgi:hypothetical protein
MAARLTGTGAPFSDVKDWRATARRRRSAVRAAAAPSAPGRSTAISSPP